MAADGGPRENAEKRYRVLLTVWGALLGGLLLFAALAWLLAAGALGGGPWSRGLEPERVQLLLFGPVGLMVVGIFARRRGRPVPGDRDPAQAYQTRIVLASALQEGGGLLGVILSLLAAQPTWILMMAGLAAFAMIRSRPRRGELLRLLRGRGGSPRR